MSIRQIHIGFIGQETSYAVHVSLYNYDNPLLVRSINDLDLLEKAFGRAEIINQRVN
jgi:hypothetical protein